MPLRDTHAEVMVVLPPKDRATPDRVFVYQNTPPEPAEADVSATTRSGSPSLFMSPMATEVPYTRDVSTATLLLAVGDVGKVSTLRLLFPITTMSLEVLDSRGPVAIALHLVPSFSSFDPAAKVRVGELAVCW